MAFNLWTLLPAVTSLAGNLLARPKRKDFTLDTGFLDKFINNLRGQRVSSQVAHFAMRPMLRAIGQQGRRFDRSVDVLTSRSGAGPGVEAALRLKGNEQALGAIERAGEKAFALQYGENRRLQQSIENIELQKGQILASGNLAFNQAKRQSTANIIGSAASLGVQTVSHISSIRANERAVLGKLKSLDLVDDNISTQTLNQMAANRGFNSLVDFGNQLMRDRGIEQATNVLDPSNLPTADQIRSGMKSGKISLEEGKKGLQQINTIAAEFENFRNVFDIDREDITEEDIFGMVEAGEITTKQGQEFIDDIRFTQKKREFIGNYADLLTGLRSNQKTAPKNFAGRMDIIVKSDIPEQAKMDLMEKEVTFSNTLLSSHQKNIWEEFFDLDSDPANLFKLMEKAGTTVKEADFIAKLYGNKIKTLSVGGTAADKELAKTGEGVAIAQIARNRINIGQSKNASHPSYKFVNDLLNVNDIEGLTKLGSNIQELQAHVHEVAKIADIPATLPGLADILGLVFTSQEIAEFDSLDSKEKTTYLQQKYEDNIMDKVFKALKAVGFPGVTDPESIIQPLQFKGIPPDFLNQNTVDIIRSVSGEFDDLSKFIK